MAENNNKQPFMLFPTIQSRIMVGTFAFVGMMLIVFWVAINEPARMEEFTERSEGRSIETGAILFESNCSTCHGQNGYGQSGVAPALNNPQLFGYDFFADIDEQIVQVETEISELDEDAEVPAALSLELERLELEREQLHDMLVYDYSAELAEWQAALEENPEDSFAQGKVDRFNALMEPYNFIAEARARQIEILNEMMADDADEAALQSEFDSLQTRIDNNVDVRQEAFDNLVSLNDISPYDPSADAFRINALAWNGGLHDLVLTTLVSGRPTSASYWPAPMAAWSQTAGGPLRMDQLESLSDYILNWEKAEYTLEDVRNVNQFSVEPVAPSAINANDAGGDSTAIPAMDDFDSAIEWELAVVSQIEEIGGDPAVGETLYAQNGCTGCHMLGNDEGVGPNPAAIATRAADYADNVDSVESARHYLVQSILSPNSLVVDGYAAGVMPQNYADSFSVEQLANIVAYLETLE